MDRMHRSNSHNNHRNNPGGQNTRHQGQNVGGRGGQHTHHQGQSAGGRGMHGGQNTQHQGHNVGGRGGQNTHQQGQSTGGRGTHGGQNTHHQGRSARGRGMHGSQGTHQQGESSRGRGTHGGQNTHHQGQSARGRGTHSGQNTHHQGQSAERGAHGGQNSHHQGQSARGRGTHGGQNTNQQGQSARGRGTHDDPFKSFDIIDWFSGITNMENKAQKNRRGRAHSESRGGSGIRLEVHHTTGAQHSQILSGAAQGAYRDRTQQNDTTGGRRNGNPQVQASGHGSQQQRYGTPVMLSNRHKSPLRYGSQNLSASFSTKMKVSDTFSAFQTNKTGFSVRAKSVQNLSELSMESKTENNRSNENDMPISQKTVKNKKIDLQEISKLTTLEPSEIIMKLAAPGSGLREFLNENTMDFQITEGFLNILNTIITITTNQQNLIYILSHVQGSGFLKQVLTFHMLESYKAITQLHRKHLFFEHIITLAMELASIFPSSSFMEVTIIKTLVQNAFRDMEVNGNIVSTENKKKLMDLEKFLQHLQEKKGEGTLKSDNYIYIVGNKESIESDFRQLSIYPTYEDICLSQKPSMRPNIIDGSYADARSYLDTHFRLMREDFIRPLRDGISGLVTLKKQDLDKAKIDDIRIYFDAKIRSPLCTRAGIVHEVHFSNKNLKYVRWEISKRLLYGSLVCLSNDNFKNMLFATVADRKVSDLQKGVIALIFTEESRQQMAQYAVDDNFLMIEATTYFEAYRHVLEGLKEMVASEIPFQNYIVFCNTTMYPPLYVSQNPAGYTLEKLIKSDKSAIQQYHNAGGPLHPLGTTVLNMFLKKQFNVLDSSTWPTKEELQLDQSQFKAFQMALTSELSIIQGPPGTGKTYVGLKILYALLNNSSLWKQGNNPILVVCYTNHALDQFLEGILKYLKCNIVRVGSRSSSEIMQKCSLSKIRSQKSRQNLPGYMRALHAELSDERKLNQDNLVQKSVLLQNATNEVLHESVLEKYIPPHHFHSLMLKKEYQEIESSSEISSIILEWLGISAVNQNTPEKKQDVTYWDIENFIKENDELSEDSMAMEAEEDEFIKVTDEAELAETERMIEEDDDIRREIKVARRIAEMSKKESLLFVEDEYEDEQESEDHGTDTEPDYQDGWQMPSKMKKKLKKQMKHELQETSHMEEEECKLIVDLFQLSLKKRWEVYRCWRSKYLCDIRNEIFTVENLYQIVVNRMAELRNQEDLLILQEADIIGMTTTGAAKFRRLLQNVQPKIVIVEEAAEVLEAHIITTLNSSCQHLILIGDHQQLRPSTTVYELAKNFNLEVSMFERLIRMKIPYVRLDYQHRMRPEIAQLLTPHIYDKLENNASVLTYENIKGVCHSLFFVDHHHLEEHIKEGKSHQNVHEATFVKSLCFYFIQQGYSPSQITILTTYSGQLHCLQKMMPKAQFQGVRVCVVDKYQGEENEIIILSLVRSNLVGNVGFLKIPNRVCVALSRAKKGLFCIGNMELLSKVPLWSAINDVLDENGLIGKELKLQCVNHPDTATYVSKSSDFADVPEGGCKIPCQFRLNCGHVCPLLCHPYDQQHENVVCRKPCTKSVCENGHKCRKLCGDPCGKCEEVVPKGIPLCGHIQDVPCSMDPEEFGCKGPCIKILHCGHKCVRLCGQICKCPEKVTVTLECGHTVKTLCFMKTEVELAGTTLKCHVKCEEKLDCGHNCPGNCNSCDTRGFHLTCGNACGIPLYCSHKCEEKCNTRCFCNRSCENSCFHGKCLQKCSEPCAPCTKPCGWWCKHKRCTKLCWEPCDREACDEPCRKNLKCGHPCIGFCGEPCPKKCRVCDADEVQELIFGNETKSDARFVQLMDCPHFFEETSFSEWMVSKEEDQIIKLKSCPKCLKPIRKSLRYGNLIKQTLSDLEKVKERISYKWINNLEMFLSENETELCNFPQLDKTVQQLQEGNLTLRSLMLVAEKVIFWQKLGAIQNRVKKSPKILIRILNDIPILSQAIVNATSKYDILEKYYELFRMALVVEATFIEQNMPEISIQKIKLLINEMYSEERTVQLDELHAHLQKFPVHMDLINVVKEKTVIYDTELLRQQLWHRCDAGHIYTTNVDENKSPCCPQCNFSDEDGEEDEDADED
ncbi:NFX1-type zinc finger-containing protein 1-like isoform X8 [Phyllobates terribilis]|uniref:NFX1-type zinc finger-containing protein 1-like isoform X6 n=1 Tax=Phyllobates terribilis TaxID=111132 RepID=UPI003CCB5441